MRLSTDKDSDLGLRTRKYAARIIRLYASLPKKVDAQIIGKQLLRAGTSVGAQVAESNRAKSRADFVNKVEGAMQELEETIYWMKLLIETDLMKTERLRDLMNESEQIMSVLVTIVSRTRRNDAK